MSAAFQECCRGICSIGEHKDMLDRFYCEIVGILSESAVLTKTKPKFKHVKSKNLSGWNDYVKEAHREARLKFKVWVSCNRPAEGKVYEEMCDARRIFKGRLKWCQKNQDQLKMNILASHRSRKNFSTFWKETRKHDTRPGLPAGVDGKSEPEEIATMFMEHFRVRSPLGPSAGVVDAVPACLGEESLIHFTAKNVKAVIKSMSGGKSPGHDGLSIEHFRYAGVHLPRVLATFLTMCMRHSHLPAQFMKTVVVPIVKNRTGDISDRANYRPISLATTAAKILDGMLDTCLNEYLNIEDAQFGFRPGLSTESAILALKHTVQYYTNRRTPVYACFLDLSKAFDLVSYDVLWRKLRDRGVPADVLCILQYWYLNQVNVVRWSNVCSESYRLECGVRQGGRTSPKLFSLYVNDLIAGLGSARVGCMVDGVSINNISYADDMVLLGPTVGSIRHMLAICESYAERHGLVYNVKKSEYMVFEAAGRKLEEHPDLILDGKPINKVSTFKYLGHYLTSDLKDDVDIERERRSLAIRGNMLIRRFSCCNEQVKVTLFKAYCQSLYTGSLWTRHTKRSLETLRILYNNVFRMMLGLPRYCSASGMFAHYETDGFHAMLRKKTASLIRRLRGGGNVILKTVADRYDSPLWQSLMRRVIAEIPLLPPL